MLNPNRIFVLINLPNSGHFDTVVRIFGRKNFFPLKSPLTISRFGAHNKFAVMGTNNSRCTTAEYIVELNKVLASHTQLGIHFVLNLAMYMEGPHDIGEVIEILNKQSNSVHYFVLVNNYKDDRKITDEMQAQLKKLIRRGSIHRIDMLVKNSNIRMEQRSSEITEIISDILDKSVFYPL